MGAGTQPIVPGVLENTDLFDFNFNFYSKNILAAVKYGQCYSLILGT